MNKGLMAGAVTIVLVVALALGFMIKARAVKSVIKPADATVAAVTGGKAVEVVPAKRSLSGGMGGLIVRLLGEDGKEASRRVRVFKALDSRSGVYYATITTNKIQELSPGAYDIEVETTPAMVFKGIKISKGAYTTEDLGCYTGSLEVAIRVAGQASARYPVKIYLPGSRAVLVTGAVNTPRELAAGEYDIEIATLPKQVRKAVKVEPGKKTLIDLGSAGTLLVKTMDERGKIMRVSVKVTNTADGETVVTRTANSPIAILPGMYNIEVLSANRQTENNVKIVAGRQEVVQLVLQSAAKPTGRQAAAVKATAVPGVKAPAIATKK